MNRSSFADLDTQDGSWTVRFETALPAEPEQRFRTCTTVAGLLRMARDEALTVPCLPRGQGIQRR